MLITTSFVDNFLPKYIKKVKKFGFMTENPYLCVLNKVSL